MIERPPRQAIALTYDGEQAPTLSAKGDDELAEAIIALAREHEVPIYENAELVRLLARLELGDQIPEALVQVDLPTGKVTVESDHAREPLAAAITEEGYAVAA